MKKKTTKRLWTRWAALFALTAILAACGAAVTSDPEPAANQEPAEPQATCVDLAISVLERGAGVHGAIVADKLHMGGATAPATCMDPANQSLLAGLSVPDGRTEQAQQSQYYLIVIRYPGGNRLYVLSRRADGTSCVVDTNDECIARVTDLPDDFDLETLPDDVAPIIPAGRPAPPTVGPSPGDDETPPAPGDDTPPAPGPAPGDETPPAPSPPPGDGAPPGAAGSRQPRDGATGVSRIPLLSWPAVPGAVSYDLYVGTAKELDLIADTLLWGRDWPINTTKTSYKLDISGLLFNTLNYWRVDAKTEDGTIRGNVWSFTTASRIGAPSDPKPRDGATGVTVDGPLLSWAAVPGAEGYVLRWGTNKPNFHDFGWSSLETSSTFARLPTSANLTHETLYYWRVQAWNESGFSERGSGWSFTTAPEPPPPPPEATLSISADQRVLEGDDGHTVVTFMVTLSSSVSAVTATDDDIHIHWRTVDGTATGGWAGKRRGSDQWEYSVEGTDYLTYNQYDGVTRCRNVPEGSTPRVCGPNRVGPLIVGDQRKEEDETVFVEIAPVKGFRATCGRCRAKLTIIDDD